MLEPLFVTGGFEWPQRRAAPAPAAPCSGRSEMVVAAGPVVIHPAAVATPGLIPNGCAGVSLVTAPVFAPAGRTRGSETGVISLALPPMTLPGSMTSR
jgi:hypothetical protein